MKRQKKKKFFLLFDRKDFLISFIVNFRLRIEKIITNIKYFTRKQL